MSFGSCPATARYLGMQISPPGCFVPAIDEVRRRFVAVQCARSPWLLLQLVRACVSPVACVGSEVWGVLRLTGAAALSRSRLASTHVSHLRSVAGLRRSIASDIVLAELGCSPLTDLWLLGAVRLYNSLLASGPFFLGLLQDADRLATGAGCWLGGLRQALRGLGYPLPAGGGALVPISPGAVAALQRAAAAARWAHVAPCPRSAPRVGARLCTYGRWFLALSGPGGAVLRLPVPFAVLRDLLRFRTGCHGLPRDVGSRGRGPAFVPRQSRLCPLCHVGPGDELHLVFECSALHDLRGASRHLFAGRATLRDFMWQPDLAAVAFFVHRCMCRVRSHSV